MNQRSETLSFKAEKSIAEQLRQEAEAEERTLSWLVNKAVKHYLQSTQNKSTVSNFAGANGALVGTN